jgi:hypothetical protein
MCPTPNYASDKIHSGKELVKGNRPAKRDRPTPSTRQQKRWGASDAIYRSRNGLDFFGEREVACAAFDHGTVVPIAIGPDSMSAPGPWYAWRATGFKRALIFFMAVEAQYVDAIVEGSR